MNPVMKSIAEWLTETYIDNLIDLTPDGEIVVQNLQIPGEPNGILPLKTDILKPLRKYASTLTQDLQAETKSDSNVKIEHDGGDKSTVDELSKMSENALTEGRTLNENVSLESHGLRTDSDSTHIGQSHISNNKSDISQLISKFNADQKDSFKQECNSDSTSRHEMSLKKKEERNICCPPSHPNCIKAALQYIKKEENKSFIHNDTNTVNDLHNRPSPKFEYKDCTEDNRIKKNVIECYTKKSAIFKSDRNLCL
ncbi:hypothetical protein CEXT_26731 [Caerostris extrusa]|uniref:Uncharacterized protein n=1 Tax=Caerostris extrusa TaxID=172846 RepID=A0AAV4XY06_CAEEX|nr:hypothetical protein CEXT_26731 [Caerostris extrusa]